MISFLRMLVPRHYHSGEIIYEELEEISEITFVEKGSYYVGYDINKSKKMRLHFPPGNLIGAINCLFLKKSWHIYQCKFDINGYAISRSDWLTIEAEFEFMATEVKKKMFIFFLKEIRRPLFNHKMRDLE